MIPGMPRKFYVAATAACLAFIVFATLCPMHDRPHLWGAHEAQWIVAIERLSAFVVLGFAARFALSARLSFLVVLAAAIGLELLQGTVHRDPHITDALIKIVGGVIGIVLAYCALEGRRLHQTEQSPESLAHSFKSEGAARFPAEPN
jgi:hypothetical protein